MLRYPILILPLYSHCMLKCDFTTTHHTVNYSTIKYHIKNHTQNSQHKKTTIKTKSLILIKIYNNKIKGK